MFGISLATYLLPTLAGLATDKNYPEFRATLRHGLSTLIFLNLIASASCSSRWPSRSCGCCLSTAAFTGASTVRVAYALTCLAPGLVMFSTVNILARAFYALGDTKTPMKISLVCLAFNLAAAAVCWTRCAKAAPASPTPLTSCFNVGLLLFALRKKLGKLEMESLRQNLLWLLALTIMAGLIAYEGWRLWENSLGHGNVALKIGAVFVPAGIAGLVYWLAALAFKIPAAKEMTEFALAKFRKSR